MKNKIVWILSGPQLYASARLHGYNLHRKLRELNYASYILFNPVNRSIHVFRNVCWWIFLIHIMHSGDVLVLQKIKKGWSKNKEWIINMFRKKGVIIIGIDCDLPISITWMKLLNKLIVPSEVLQRITQPYVSTDYIEDSPELYDSRIHCIEKNKLNIYWFGTISDRRREDIRYIYEVIGKSDLYSHYTINIISDDADIGEVWTGLSLQKIAAHCDIVLFPIMNRDISDDAKSANKILQAMALSKVVIASPIPSYSKVIEDGKNGYLFNTEEQLISVLYKCLDTAERHRIMREAYTSVQKYSLDNLFPQWTHSLCITDHFIDYDINKKRHYFLSQKNVSKII